MDRVISSTITPVGQSLMALFNEHLGFLVSSTKYVTEMKAKMNLLNLDEQDIRRQWEEAVARNHEVPHHVEPWLEEVKKINEKAKSIPTGGIGCFNYVAKRYEVGKQSYNILGEIQDLEKRKSEIKFTNAQKSLADVASTSTWPSTSTRDGTQNNFKSRDPIYKAALKSLQSNNESDKMIALCGMGGVGKTTMMEHLKKDVEVSKMFYRIVKVVIGEKTNLFALQSAIAEYIGEKLSETTEEARVDRLRILLEGMSQKGQKKILVIMDDLWNYIDLKDVGLCPLPDGFKLLFTSRIQHVCTRMGVKTCSIFDVGVLDDAEAQTLFFENVECGDDPRLQKIGEDIVKQCGGLPIAIVTIAKSLSGKIKEVWEKALRRLEKDELKDLESITHRIFEISYENIKEEDDKAIFLLSGLFPDDFDIRTEDLLMFGWGLGFFKDAGTLTTARNDMKICVSNLICANLLTKSDQIGCVKMHDLVRAFVLDKVSEVKQASIVNLDNKAEQRLTNESYDRVLLKCTGLTEFPAYFKYPNLSMLMLMNGDESVKFPEGIYERMEKLQVVSYENMQIPSLLLTLEHCVKLRTLCLRSCRFINDDISLLGSLNNLETLSFVDCEISWLPSTIGKLKKLKLLDLTGCVDLRIDDGVFQNLESLEELYMRAYDENSPIRFTKANCDELEILSQRLFALELGFFENWLVHPKNMSFKNLERFRISIGCKLEELEDAEENLFKNTIQLVGECNELLECKISELFNKTEELYLKVNEMNHLEDVLLTQHSFSNLTILHISNCADLKCLFTFDVASGLKQLERLTILECPVMRSLVVENSRMRKLTFQKLKFMSLTGLPKMVSFWDNVIELPEMVELILDDLPNFTSIYPHSQNTFDMQSLLNQKVVIPRLEKLDIFNMENLKHIWSCEATDENNVSNLRKIIVRNCDNLVNLFSSNPLSLLNDLEELEVEDCGSIEVLFNMEFESICGTQGYNRSKLRSITITGCPVFKNILTPLTVDFDLGALTHYVTKNTSEKTQMNGVSKAGERSEMDEYTLNVTYPSYLLHTCHHLQRLELDNDERVKEVVFEMDSHQPPLLLPYLEVLKLEELNEMSHVWKCNNWNKFLIPQHQPSQLPFQNLTVIILWSSHKIKYLFSPLMAKYLSNLKKVDIIWCNGIEEVISSRDDEENEENAPSTSSHQNTSFFPHLDTLELQTLSCLKSIDDGCDQTRSGNLINTIHCESQSGQVMSACWSLCQYPTKINLYNCKALSSLVPWYALGHMERLQELEIEGCGKMMEVFESELSSTSTLENITTTALVIVPQLSNLKVVTIDKCELLSHVFTFSMLASLNQLKDLKVTSCDAIQVIVKEENDESSSKDVVVLPRLERLELEDLPNLKGFFLGKNDFRWPSLDYVMIDKCPQLMMFTGGESKTPKLEYIRTRFGKYSVVECGLNLHGTINVHQTTFPTCSSSSSDPSTISKGIMPLSWSSFHNLIEINISFRRDVGRSIIPSNVLLQLEKLQKIELDGCGGVEEVFEVEALVEGSGFNESQTTTTLVTIPNLRQMYLNWMYDLKYLWKSNRSMVLLDFPNLTTLSINICHKLEHVFTCSMVGSLLQLQDLEISNCVNIEVIVKKEEEECEFKVNLPRLKSLKLASLPKLEGLCLGKEDSSFPLLDTLEIRRCPAFKGFTKGYLSTPELKVIKTTFGKWYVKPDLNSFIKTKQDEGYEF